MKRAQWTPEAEALLEATLDGFSMHVLAEQVRAGELELWQLDEAYAVVEHTQPGLYVWAFAGRGIKRGAQELIGLAWARGCREILFRTRHRGIPRMLAHLRPRWLHRIGDRHAEYSIAVSA